MEKRVFIKWFFVLFIRGARAIVIGVFIQTKAAVTVVGRPWMALSWARVFLVNRLEIPCSEGPCRAVRRSRGVTVPPRKIISGVSPVSQRRLAEICKM